MNLMTCLHNLQSKNTDAVRLSDKKIDISLFTVMTNIYLFH